MNTDVSVVRTDVQGHEDELRELLREYFERSSERGREWLDDEEFGADAEGIVAADLERLASAAIARPLFLALYDGRIVGSVQSKRLDGTTAEVKRLYVRPDYRAEGIGRALVEEIISWAASAGFETLRLGVAPFHEEAQSLYLDLGFEFTPQYDASQAPAELRDDWNFMKLSLGE